MHCSINFSNCKFKWKKRFWEFLFVISFVPAKNYLFKVSNLRTRVMCESCLILRMLILTIFNIKDVSGVFLVSLLLTVNIFQTLFQLLTVNRQTFAWFISNRQTHLKTKSDISCLTYYLKCEQIFLTNSIWTYTITTLWVNQWEIIAKEFTSEHDSGKKNAAHIQNNLLYVHLSLYRFCLLEDKLDNWL